MLFEIKLKVEGDTEPTLHKGVVDTIIDALSVDNAIFLKGITISPAPAEFDPRIIQGKIRRLYGRSKIIANFLLENPGPHSTAEIKEKVNAEQPFVHSSILHSYLNNLVSRGIIVKIASGSYQGVDLNFANFGE